jgi:hypothetical protein
LTVPNCLEWFVGIGRFSSELWAVSHPAALVHDVLPVVDKLGRPIRYVWAYSDIPDLDAWEPQLEAFPRPGISAAEFIGPRWAEFISCSTVSLRASQYRAAYGPSVMDRLPAAGLYCSWLRLANTTLLAPSPERKSSYFRRYLEDLRAHSNGSECLS